MRELRGGSKHDIKVSIDTIEDSPRFKENFPWFGTSLMGLQMAVLESEVEEVLDSKAKIKDSQTQKDLNLRINAKIIR